MAKEQKMREEFFLTLLYFFYYWNPPPITLFCFFGITLFCFFLIGAPSVRNFCLQLRPCPDRLYYIILSVTNSEYKYTEHTKTLFYNNENFSKF